MAKLFISTFGEKVNWIRFKQTIPIEVGVACRPESSVHYETTDCEGESISNLNPFFGELTGIYWLWKNFPFSENEIIGFAHYNKILDINPQKAEQILRKSDVDWIVKKPVRIVKHDYKQDIEVLEDVLKSRFPSYYAVWRQLYYADGESKSETCVACEMFYTSVEEFNLYCEFIFKVLFEVFEKIGEVERVAYHKRYCAFLGERLLAVYLLRNHKTAYNVSVKTNDNAIIRILKNFYRRFGLNKNPVVNKVIELVGINKKSQSSYLK